MSKSKFQNDIYLCFAECDANFAEILENTLENFRIPKEFGFPNNHFRIFQDSPELSEFGYGDILKKQVNASRKVVIICSEEAASDSDYNDKISAFLKAHQGTSQLVLVTKADENNSKIIPNSLRNESYAKPAHFENFNSQIESPLDAKYEAAWLGLLSQITDLPEKKVLELLIKNEKASSRFKWIIAATLMSCAAIFGIWQYLQNSAADSLEIRTQTAEKYLAEANNIDVLQLPLQKMHLLAKAYSQNPPNDLNTKIANLLKPLLPKMHLQKSIESTEIWSGMRTNPNKNFLIGWSGSNIFIINLETLEVSKTVEHEAPINGVEWFENGRSFYSWSSDGTVRIWNTEGTEVSKIQTDKDVVKSIISKDEKYTIAINEEFAAQLWQNESNKILKNIEHNGWIGGAVFSPSSAEFLTWSDDSTFQRRVSKTGDKIGRFSKLDGSLNGTFYVSDTEIIAWTSVGSIYQLNTNTSQLRKIGSHDEAVLGCKILENGNLLSWGRDDRAIIWQNEKIRFSLTHEGWVFGADLQPNSENILTWSFDNSAKIWNFKDGVLKNTVKHRRINSKSDEAIYNAFWLNNSLFATSGMAGEWRIWTVDSAEPFAVISHNRKVGLSPVEFPAEAVWLETQNVFITINGDKYLKIWKLEKENSFENYSPDSIVEQIIQQSGTQLNSENEVVFLP